MRETLYDMARFQYKVAEIMFQHILEDDSYLNATGFHLQQATELALKHILEMAGIKYPKTRVISELLALVPRTAEIDLSNIAPMADTITLWESKTRYIKGYRTAKKSLEDGFRVIGTLLDDIDTLSIKQVTEKDILLSYIDEEELEDFYNSIPSSIVVNQDNVEMLTAMYKSMKRK